MESKQNTLAGLRVNYAKASLRRADTHEDPVEQFHRWFDEAVSAELPEPNVPVQVAFSVPKRRFKRAVDRNRIKRQLREVYRTNKSELYTVLRDRQKTIALAVLFTGKEGPEFVELEKQLILTLTRLRRKYEATD